MQHLMITATCHSTKYNTKVCCVYLNNGEAHIERWYDFYLQVKKVVWMTGSTVG